MIDMAAAPAPPQAPAVRATAAPRHSAAKSKVRRLAPPISYSSSKLSHHRPMTHNRMVRGRMAQSDMAHRPTTESGAAQREQYAAVSESPFSRVSDKPLSTFSIDVDTASYSNVRRFLKGNQLPPHGAVRVEELINYFPFDYSVPQGDTPFSVTVELSDAPWNTQHQLLHIGIQGKRMQAQDLPTRNLVFLLDVSGSMRAQNKLPLLKRSLATLTETLREQDQVAIVVYAGSSGLVLPATSGDQQARIVEALDRLQAGGGTNGASGIALAYEVAGKMITPGSSTRVILATDGDFNLGMTSDSALYDLIKAKRSSGIFLSVLGLGMGNYQDTTLEMLADKGNGNYAYLDSLSEARKVLVREGGATLTTLAKDVKLQIEFNPSLVSAYRLIGYENRRLSARDFNDDKKDAGELGAGHSVTALYEIIGTGTPIPGATVDALKYQTPHHATALHKGELAQLKLRYKHPQGNSSRLLTHAIGNNQRAFSETSDTFRFSAAVAAFGMSLNQSKFKGSASFSLAKQLGQGALGSDPHGYRREFVSLVDLANGLASGLERKKLGRQ